MPGRAAAMSNPNPLSYESPRSAALVHAPRASPPTLGPLPASGARRRGCGAPARRAAGSRAPFVRELTCCCIEVVEIGECGLSMRVDVVDPSAYAPHYDHGLCAALARAGASVRLVTSDFRYGPVPAAVGYDVERLFYRRAAEVRRRRLRRAAKLAQHPFDMARYQRQSRNADVLHFQWFAVEPLDVALRPRGRPLVMTAHLVMPLRCSALQAVA